MYNFSEINEMFFQVLLQSCAVKKSILYYYEDYGYSVILM